MQATCFVIAQGVKVNLGEVHSFFTQDQCEIVIVSFSLLCLSRIGPLEFVLSLCSVTGLSHFHSFFCLVSQWRDMELGFFFLLCSM
jgi:hypothetical protein